MKTSTKYSRKRTLDDENSDPCRFLSSYYVERGIPESPDDDGPLLDDCVRRAELARESFKRWRSCGDDSGTALAIDPAIAAAEAAGTTPPTSTATLAPGEGESDKGTNGQPSTTVNVASLTPHEKYQRRLVNNRKSAAAARVYQEVLRREHTHALRTVCAERDSLRDDVLRLEDTLRRLREENSKLAESEATAAISASATKPEQSDLDVVAADDKGADDEEPDHESVASSEPKAASAEGVVVHDDGMQKPPASTLIEVSSPADIAQSSRPVLPSLFGSQQSQDDGRMPIPSFSSFLNSQNSQGESIFGTRGLGLSNSQAVDDLPDTMELFAGSQGVMASQSQGLASQGLASQGLASQGFASQLLCSQSAASASS